MTGGALCHARTCESRRSADLALLPTFRRLLRLWRKEWRLGVLGIAFAFCYTLISIAIPLLTQRAIDHSSSPTRNRSGHTSSRSSALPLFGSGSTSRAGTRRRGSASGSRRACASFSTAAYVRFPRAFYDRHATARCCRARTNDLYPIRYFIGWGLIQGIQSLMMIVAAASCS